ncbi:hypothetical protein RRG08_037265 [Elysia crispata]|uniref:Uncharacterized protein n=1 Tax=Elysia crispata TaxID=231223 RepID=A0AAE0XXZ0_9GAST|nr:hypothetical protein RRG08_037265 [Elysia crispata]
MPTRLVSPAAIEPYPWEAASGSRMSILLPNKTTLGSTVLTASSVVFNRSMYGLRLTSPSLRPIQQYALKQEIRKSLKPGQALMRVCFNEHALLRLCLAEIDGHQWRRKGAHCPRGLQIARDVSRVSVSARAVGPQPYCST